MKYTPPQCWESIRLAYLSTISDAIHLSSGLVFSRSWSYLYFPQILYRSRNRNYIFEQNLLNCHYRFAPNDHDIASLPSFHPESKLTATWVTTNGFRLQHCIAKTIYCEIHLMELLICFAQMYSVFNYKLDFVFLLNGLNQYLSHAQRCQSLQLQNECKISREN